MTHSRLLNAAVSLALIVPSPALAQFGGLRIPFGTSKSSSDAQPTPDNGCQTPKKKKNAAVFGAIVGAAAGSALGRTGFSRFVPLSEFTTMISTAIACRLDNKEQKQAATATEAAVKSEKVGSSSTWTSATRKDVTGTSTVTALAPTQGRAKCMMVTDVVIVDGEETKAEKKMCKGPGESRYSIAQV
jgi:surface antigen